MLLIQGGLVKPITGPDIENGQILIGDVAFQSRDELEKCRQETGDEWDNEENYFVADEMKKEFPGLEFTKISCCAGILRLAK